MLSEVLEPLVLETDTRNDSDRRKHMLIELVMSTKYKCNKRD